MGRPKKDNIFNKKDETQIEDEIVEEENIPEVVVEANINKKDETIKIFCQRCGSILSKYDKKCIECLAPTEWKN